MDCKVTDSAPSLVTEITTTPVLQGQELLLMIEIDVVYTKAELTLECDLGGEHFNPALASQKIT